MNPLQARKQLQTGKIINVFIAVSNPDWESQTIPIRIPVRKGLLNYRLLLIHKNDLKVFEKINTLSELKRQTAGLLYGWSITQTMLEQGFRIKKGNNYDSLFQMLNSHRFDFVPRGVNEIFDEVKLREKTLKNITIEPHLALYLPAPSYIFVSPAHPRIAKRLKEGLELMIQDGSFDQLFHQYFDDDLAKAKLNERTILKLDNIYAPVGMPLDRPELWFTP
jgi:hypothetical protein